MLNKYIKEIGNVLANLSEIEWQQIIACFENAWRDKRAVYIIGNGGSASTASHMANDLMMGVAKKQEAGFCALSLCDNTSVTMAAANDHGFSEIFSRQVIALGKTGDLLVVISGSGNSPNVVEAVKVAKSKGMICVGLLGMGGGLLKSMIDASIIVPSDDYGIIETVHLMLDHLLTEYFKGYQG